MKFRTLALIGILIPLVGGFIYVSLRTGPLAPALITATTIEKKAISPALFGIGIVEARYTYKIGPTVAGRLKRVDVQVGDSVKAGQVLGEMDPVDLDEQLNAQNASRQRAQAAISAAQAQVQDHRVRLDYANTQLQRYRKLLPSHVVSVEVVDGKRQEQQIAEAGLTTSRANLEQARRDMARIDAEQQAVVQQRDHLLLVAPADGLVVARDADPGTTLVAGQAVVVVVDPNTLWVNTRFDQISASGLKAGLPAHVVLRSQANTRLAGRVLRVEPLADAVTEESLAKIVFNNLPGTLPLVGELAEVTVELPARVESPVISNASLRRLEGRLGVWVIEHDHLRFAPVKIGTADLEGRVQILEGVDVGDTVVVYSQKTLTAGSRFKVVEHLPGMVS